GAPLRWAAQGGGLLRGWRQCPRSLAPTRDTRLRMDRASLVVRPTCHSRPGRWAVRAVFGLAAFGDRLLPDLLSHHPGHLAVPTGSISLGDPALARADLGGGSRGALATLAP